ncbi:MULTISPECIES: hypothetical protein [unclassified Sinorhizobium]|uniref:hypothetical protein n=1 Tax=unclassified Sinorhizobium TaxID=2613772 RepID=UPI003524B6D3
MKRTIVIVAAISALSTTALSTTATPAAAQVVVSKDCRLSRFIEAYAWQALDDAERTNVSADLQNGLRVYLRTVRDQTKKVCSVGA